MRALFLVVGMVFLLGVPASLQAREGGAGAVETPRKEKQRDRNDEEIEQENDAAGDERKREVDKEKKEATPTRKSSLGPIRPGLAIKSGGGFHRSLPCECFDRGLFTTEVVGRVHFGWRFALEADVRFGSMLLGGRFPGQGWAMGGMLRLVKPKSRWFHGAHLRAGFRQWQVMGMRAEGTPGGYGALMWQIPVFSFLNVELDLVTGRTFQAMEHWYFVGTAGISLNLPR